MSFQYVYDKEIQALGVDLLDAPWKNKSFYAVWLAQTYYFVKDSTRLLMLSGARMPHGQQKLHLRFIEHASEEKGHEQLLLRDLKSLGYNVHEIPELPIVAGFYQSQYHWIDYKNPVAFFGYILVLEGIACNFGPQIYPVVKKTYGRNAVTFIGVHAEEDVDHIEKALLELRSLPPHQLELVEENFRLSIGFYRSIIKDCVDLSNRMCMRAKKAG